MPVTYAEEEERILEACDDLENQENPLYAATARKFGVHPKRLYRRFTGRTQSRIDAGGTNKVLDDAAEHALCMYIDFADDLGIPIREKTLTKAANSILQNRRVGEDPPRVVSKMWASRWLARHPEYKKRARKPLAVARKNTHNPEAIQCWFDKLLAVKERFGILDSDIHNMDETGFRIGVGRAHKVITRAGNNRQYLADPDNRDYITSIESISAAGESHAPLLILKAASLQERWIADELDENTILSYSESGYSNDKINLEWLMHFDKITQRKTKGTFRLLILDGFSSHIEYDFVEYAQQHQIILFGLPPHTTHFLQPLDVVCFQPLKHYHSEAIDNAVRSGDTTFSKTEFLAAFESIRKQTFKQSTILSAFRKTGIIPHDPSKVLEPLQEKIEADRKAYNTEGYNAMLVENEVISDVFEDPTTPTDPQELYCFGQEILDELPNASELSPQLSTRIQKYIKGASVRIDFGAQAEKDLQHTQAAEAARAARKKKPNRQLLQGGIISVKEARQRIKQRQFGDTKAETARVAKLLKREKRAFFVQFDKAAAVARERIRRKQLQTEFGLDI
jgi:DDE superfamily endonuclease/Tc5 transposase DNA-binding domain